MKFVLSPQEYADYLNLVYERIHGEKDYISELDAAIGDGDHWANMDVGFKALAEANRELGALSFEEEFKKIGYLMMTKVGGSSGILYGGGYMAAAKALAGCSEMDIRHLSDVLLLMVEDMMRRGGAQPGMKTMIDSLYPAAHALRDALEADGEEERACLEAMKRAALEGCESTKQMEARKGRASNRANKGVGHLDPGAVTMSFQLQMLCDYILENKL